MDEDDDGPVRTLFPELPPELPRWEVTLTRHHEAGAELVVPCGAPGVLAAYSITMAMAIVIIGGPADEREAEAAARLLCAGMAWTEEAVAEVRPVSAVDLIAGR